MSSERTIQESVRQLFINHKYILTNSFVFAWESDFFSVTKSGNVYEVEVKISKADYKKDFEKDKHNFFTTMQKGKRFIVRKSDGYLDSDLLFNLKVYSLVIAKSYMYRSNKVDETFTHEEDSFGYWYKLDPYILIQEKWKQLHAAASRVEIIDLQQKNIPNRFYYACPEGVINEKDLPPYAGLIYVKDSEARIVKQAPFITKGDILTRIKPVLLDKFYYLSVDYRYKIRLQEYQNKEA